MNDKRKRHSNPHPCGLWTDNFQNLLESFLCVYGIKQNHDATFRSYTQKIFCILIIGRFISKNFAD